MSYVRIWLHCVWGTKNRIFFLNDSNKQTILNHIKENAISKDIYIDFLNGLMSILRFQLVSHKLIMCANTLRIRKFIIKRKVGRMNTMNLSKSLVLLELMAKAQYHSFHVFPTINGGVSHS